MVNQALTNEALQRIANKWDRSEDDFYVPYAHDHDSAFEDAEADIKDLLANVYRLKEENRALRKAIDQIAKIMYEGGTFDEASDVYDDVMEELK